MHTSIKCPKTVTGGSAQIFNKIAQTLQYKRFCDLIRKMLNCSKLVVLYTIPAQMSTSFQEYSRRSRILFGICTQFQLQRARADMIIFIHVLKFV